MQLESSLCPQPLDDWQKFDSIRKCTRICLVLLALENVALSGDVVAEEECRLHIWPGTVFLKQIDVLSTLSAKGFPTDCRCLGCVDGVENQRKIVMSRFADLFSDTRNVLSMSILHFHDWGMKPT